MAGAFDRRQSVTAESVGAVAGEILGRGGVFEAFAVFNRSFYMRDAQGAVLCCLDAVLEPGPLHVLCREWPKDLPDRVMEGEMFRVAGARAIGSGLVVELSGAAPWRPPPFPAAPTEKTAQGMRCLLALLPLAAPHTLAAALLSGIDAGGGDAFYRALKAEVRKGLAAVTRWLGAPSPAATDAAFSLVGLGPGLTPSGDDILSGILLALHALGKYDDFKPFVDAGAPRFFSRTNAISRAHLEAAADGQGAAVFHDCLNDILTGGARLSQLLLRIAKVGHTSGWDALLGMAWVIRWQCDRGGEGGGLVEVAQPFS